MIKTAGLPIIEKPANNSQQGWFAMLHKLDRWIYFNDMILNPSPQEAPEIPMKIILGLTETYLKTGNAVWVFNKKTAAVRLLDIKHDHKNDITHILISYADKNISDPVFEDLETGLLRDEPKLDGEGIAVSAHMSISRTSTEVGGRSYLCLLEDIPGIGRTKLRSFLTNIFKESSDLTFKGINDSVKKYRPAVEIDGHAGGTFGESIIGGSKITEIELVKYPIEQGQFGEANIIREKKRTVSLGVKNDISYNGIVELISKVKEKAATEGYSDLKIRYNRPEKKSESILTGTAREDSMDALCVTSHKISVEKPLKQCHPTIRSDVSSLMSDLLIKHRIKIGKK